MLTHDQEMKLVKHYRKLYAKILRDERKLYRLGGEAMANDKRYRHNDYLFITSKPMITFSASGDLDLDRIIEQKQYTENLMQRNDALLSVTFGVEDMYDHNRFSCGDCGRGDTDPSVEISFVRFGFLPLTNVKRLITSRTNDRIKDARFKFIHQANGKDVRRYLEIIEKVK